MNYFSLKHYKTDIIAVLLWILLFFILLYLTFQKWGSPIVDCGRDVYVAEQFLRGDRLYVDIYYIYGPLSIYVLSGFFWMFGAHLDIAYLCGIVFSLLSLFLIYSISRTLLSPLFSFLVNAICIIVFCFNSGIFNYIFPYTYSALIGMFLGLLLIFSLIKHLIRGKNIYLYLAGTAIGLSSLTKIEFFTASLGLFIMYIALNKAYKHNTNWKSILLSVVLGSILPLISSFYILYVSGLNQILGYFRYNKETLSSEASLYIIKGYFGWENFVSSIQVMPEYLLKLLLLIVCLNIIIHFLVKFNFHKHVRLTILVLVTFLLLYIKYISPDTIFSMFFIKYIIASYIPIIISIYLVFLVINKLILRNTFTLNDKILAILAFYTFLLTLRCYFHLSITYYGVFYLPLTVVMAIYFVTRIPQIMDGKFKFKNFNYYWCTTASIFLVLFLITSYSSYFTNMYTVETSKGKIISNRIIAEPIQNLSNYIIKNTKPTDEIVLIPEEILIYFLSSRKSATKFYDYLPIRLINPRLEDNFIETLKRKNIKLIAISNRPSQDYKFTYWGIDYNQKIYNWIKSNYKLCTTFGHYHTTENFLDPYGIKVYMKQCP